MSLMLPAEPAHARSLTGVLAAASESVRGHEGWLPAARSAVVLVIDGLGAANLDARAGHARFLHGAKARKDIARTVFPTTTAAALTSLLTGVDAGTHGVVGYRVRVPETGVVANQLTGWDAGEIDPADWQRARTVFERHPQTPAFIVSKPEYRTTGFTRAAFRGAEFVGEAKLEARLLRAVEVAHAHPGSVVYTYAPELDSLGHRVGWESDAWIAQLERVDAAVRGMAEAAPRDVGLIVTADHGMVDVPAHSHILLGEADPLLDGVADVAGEPRMLHLYAEPGAAAGVLERWRSAEEKRAWVFSREEAIEAGLFGAVSPEVAPRIGDVLVAARALVAYYDDRLADKAGQRMVGQHGSLTSAERLVPLIRLGAYAR